MKIINFKAHNDIEYVIRIILPMDKYGVNDSITHYSEIPLIEFNVPVQNSHHMISRYDFPTFLNADDGILLDGGFPQYTIDANDVSEIKKEINNFLDNGYVNTFTQLGSKRKLK